MLEANFSTVLVVLFFAAALAYRFSFFRKKVGHLTLLQIFYLVVVPGVLFPFINAYMQSILARPVNSQVFLSDGVLVNITLLSFMFGYGGVAMHTVSKTLAHPELLRHANDKAGEVNRFFHMTFSHTMAYSGLMGGIFGLLLLEMNHIPPSNTVGITEAVIKGLLMGAAMLVALFFYTRSDWILKEKEYVGRWRDLRVAFVVFWVGFMLVLLGLRKVSPSLTDYDLLLPALLSLSLVAVLNFYLAVRRWRREGLMSLLPWNW